MKREGIVDFDNFVVGDECNERSDKLFASSIVKFSSELGIVKFLPLPATLNSLIN